MIGERYKSRGGNESEEKMTARTNWIVEVVRQEVGRRCGQGKWPWNETPEGSSTIMCRCLGLGGVACSQWVEMMSSSSSSLAKSGMSLPVRDFC